MCWDRFFSLGKEMALFTNAAPTHRVRLHYGDPRRAKESIRYLKRQPRGVQVRGAQTMIARAKYHAHQTQGMRASMKLYRSFLRTLKHGGDGGGSGGSRDCVYHPTEKDRVYLRRWKRGESIGFTLRSSLKAKGMIPRANGTRRVSDKYCS